MEGRNGERGGGGESNAKGTNDKKEARIYENDIGREGDTDGMGENPDKSTRN